MVGRIAPQPSDGTADPRDDGSRRRARKWWWWGVGAFAFVLVIVMMWMGRQSESEVPPAPKAFCRAAAAYEKELDRQAAAYRLDTAKQIQYVEEIAATAPRSVRADAAVFLESLRAIDAAPNEKARKALQDDPEVQVAVENVNRYWNQGCGVFDRQSGI